jgi:hypothetical protein
MLRGIAVLISHDIRFKHGEIDQNRLIRKKGTRQEQRDSDKNEYPFHPNTPFYPRPEQAR